MSYYSAQAANGAYKPHNVTFAAFAEGKPIEGKLSDFKGNLRHLWRDDEPPQPRKYKPKEIIKELPKALENEYVNLETAAARLGRSRDTIRKRIATGAIKDYVKIEAPNGYAFRVNMKELIEFEEAKRAKQAAIDVDSWRIRNKDKIAAYGKKYYDTVLKPKRDNKEAA